MVILISSIPWVVEHVMMSMMVPESQIKMAKSAIFFEWRKFVQFEIVKSIEKQYMRLLILRQHPTQYFHSPQKVNFLDFESAFSNFLQSYSRLNVDFLSRRKMLRLQFGFALPVSLTACHVLRTALICPAKRSHATCMPRMSTK